MAKLMKATQKAKTEKTMIISSSDSSGAIYKLSFRTGIHKDAKKQANKRACRKFNKNLI